MLIVSVFFISSSCCARVFAVTWARISLAFSLSSSPITQIRLVQTYVFLLLSLIKLPLTSLPWRKRDLSASLFNTSAMLYYDLVDEKVLSTTLLVKVGSVYTNTYLHPVLWGTQAVLHLLQLSFQMFHSQTVTQTLPLSNFKTRLCNLLLPTNKPAIESKQGYQK